MSDELVGRYKRAYARIWRHPGFRKLTIAWRLLALYLLTGPQTNRIGLFHFSLTMAAEDLGLGADTLRKGLPNVCTTFGWFFDNDARVFYIPSWWRFNKPDNQNVLVGNLKDINEIPSCGLVDIFAANVAYVPEHLRGTFMETLRERLPKRSPTQDQEQFQEQKTGSGNRAARGSAGADAPAWPPQKKNAGKESSVDEKLQDAARKAIEMNGRNASKDVLLDTMHTVVPSELINFTEAEGLAALAAVGWCSARMREAV
jgi:hypothetical protein